MKNYSGLKTTLLLATLTTIGIAGCSTERKAAETNAMSAVASGTQASGIEKFNAYTQKFTGNTTITQNHATGHVGNFFFTHWKDGGAASLTMSTDGSFSVSWQGGGYNYVGGPGWHYGDKNRVIGYRFN
ncbi:MAG TPA: glycoside hydrolase family 11 protein, partial [Cellvibrio sp.]|nr:glycoside hydrolase family 11 protein [Cellvibrio sp.]